MNAEQFVGRNPKRAGQGNRASAKRNQALAECGLCWFLGWHLRGDCKVHFPEPIELRLSSNLKM